MKLQLLKKQEDGRVTIVRDEFRFGHVGEVHDDVCSKNNIREMWKERGGNEERDDSIEDDDGCEVHRLGLDVHLLLLFGALVLFRREVVRTADEADVHDEGADSDGE